MIEHSIFSVMAGLIVDTFHAVLCLAIMLCNGLKISEHEAYWLTGFLYLIVGRAPRNNYGNL